MNEVNSNISNVKTENSIKIDHELDLQSCIEEFDLIYQVPAEFSQVTDYEVVDTSENLTSDFDFNSVHETEIG
jgi:hypothetical protein